VKYECHEHRSVRNSKWTIVRCLHEATVTGRSNCATGVHYTTAVGIRDTQVVILAVSMEYDAYDDSWTATRESERLLA
jgi:hypothetical protein